MDLPNRELFKEAAELFEMAYQRLFYNNPPWGDDTRWDPFSLLMPDSALQKAELFALARDAAFDNIEAAPSFAAFQWLAAQPAFQLALAKLRFRNIDHKSAVEEIAEYLFKRAKEMLDVGPLSQGWTIAPSSRFSAHFIWYARVLSAIYRYLDKDRIRRTKADKAHIESLRDHIPAVVSGLEAFREYGGEEMRIGRAVASLNEIFDFISSDENLEAVTPKIRSDDSVTSRLFAADLMNANRALTGSPCLPAVYCMMGLSIVERPLEMKTLERIRDSEKDRRRSLVRAKGGRVWRPHNNAISR